MFWSHGLLLALLCHLPNIPRIATSNKHEQRHRGAARVSRTHNNPVNYFGNTSAASIFSAIIRASARPMLPQKRQALRFLLAAGTCTHTYAHTCMCAYGSLCVGVYAVAGNHGTKLESVRILSRISQTCCLRRLVRLATPYYGPTHLKSIKFDHGPILSSFVSVLEIERSIFRKEKVDH